MKEKGEVDLARLSVEFSETVSLHSTEYLSDLIVALQMVYPSICASPWKALWEYLDATWHRGTGTYTGPCIREEQKKEEPSVGLYDYFLSYYSGIHSDRIKQLQPILIHAVLLNPSEDTFDDCSSTVMLQGVYRENRWNLIKMKDRACILLEKKEFINPSKLKTYVPFRLIWGDEHRVHSFVCQSLDSNKITYDFDYPEFNLFFHLENKLDSEDREKRREVCFYSDYAEDCQILVDGFRSSTFELGRVITLQTRTCQFSLSFELVEGEGQFLGHITRGNRLSQVEIKGENRFKSYDRQIFLRTVRRQEKCLIKARIRILD